MESRAKDFLAFRRMITPLIIQIIFWIGIGICEIAGIAGIINGVLKRYGGGRLVLYSILLLVLGPIVVRIYCEMLIIFFRMNETLTDIKNKIGQGSK